MADEQLITQIQNDWFRVQNQQTVQTFCRLQKEDIEMDIVISIRNIDSNQPEIKIKKLD